MRNRRWYEWLLTITYAAMICLCIALNLFGAQKEGFANIIVNAVLFLIVGIIFITCDAGSFMPMNSIIADLEEATEKIRSDAMNSHSYLWEPYNAGKVELFKDEELKERFRDYLFELNRISHTDKAYYKCSIEHYINTDMVDTVMHRNQLNQVAGALTGLGILGTFIGLSLGLQSFSTGTTAEITKSIAPLMDGIKVAFHTSIYGMVFSLVFNYVYKRKLYEAETAVESFLNAYTKYVLPDTTTEGINRFMELQQQQVQAIKTLTDRISDKLEEVIDPRFEKLNGVVTDFGNVATRNQTEAISMVAERFVKEMDKSMEGSFQQMSDIVSQAYNLQNQNALQVQAILNEAVSNEGNLQEINRQTASLIGNLNSYTKSIQGIQNEMSKNIASLNRQYEQMRDTAAEMTGILEDVRETISSAPRTGGRR